MPKTLINSSISEIKEKYKISGYKFVGSSNPGRKAKVIEVNLPKGKPFQNVTPEEALKRIEKSKQDKIFKGTVTDTEPIGKLYNRTCKNPNCKRKFSTNNSLKVYCRPECRESFIVYGKEYF